MVASQSIAAGPEGSDAVKGSATTWAAEKTTRLKDGKKSPVAIGVPTSR